MLSSRQDHEAEFSSFVKACPLRKIQVDDEGEHYWFAYDTGPRHIECPLIMLPPLSGRATCYYKQMMGLSALGYRVISLEWPPYWNATDFVNGFAQVLDTLRIKKCHVFGSSLGGFLAQKLAEIPLIGVGNAVQSVILCNSFTSTSIFDRQVSSFFYWALPSMFLKQIVMNGFPRKRVDAQIAYSLDFMVENLESFNQADLASRLTLNCARADVSTAGRVGKLPITLIDVFDDCALSRRAIDRMHRVYPNSKRAHLKSGGNFPFLSRPADVNAYIQIHLRQFENTELTAKES